MHCSFSGRTEAIATASTSATLSSALEAPAEMSSFDASLTTPAPFSSSALTSPFSFVPSTSSPFPSIPAQPNAMTQSSFTTAFAASGPFGFGVSEDRSFNSGVTAVGHLSTSTRARKANRARSQHRAGERVGSASDALGVLSMVSPALAASGSQTDTAELALSLTAVSLDETKSNPYQKWGGLAAAVASCDDFKSVHISDHDLWVLLSKLDIMDRAGRSLKDVMAAWRQCAFTCEEVNRLNSPLLDGVFYAINNQQARGKGVLRFVTPPSLSEMLLRVLRCKDVAYLDAMSYLLCRNVEFDEDFSCTCLKAAIHSKRLAVVELLLERASKFDTSRSMAMFEAVRTECVDIIQYLLRNGIGVKQEAFTSAALSGRLDILTILYDHTDKAKQLRLGLPLHAAIARDHVDVATWLLDRGAITDWNGHNLGGDIFDLAIHERAVNVLSLLIQRGYRPDARSQVLLDRAVSLGGVAVFEVLYKNGLLDRLWSESLVRVAVHSNNVDVLRLLLAENLPRASLTPLLPVACANTNLTAVHLLLDAGADVHYDYEAALRNALVPTRPQSQPQIEELVSLLLERGAIARRLSANTYDSFLRNFLPRVADLLLGADPDPSAVPVELLICALEYGCMDSVTAYLRANPLPSLTAENTAQLNAALDAKDALQARFILRAAVDAAQNR